MNVAVLSLCWCGLWLFLLRGLRLRLIVWLYNCTSFRLGLCGERVSLFNMKKRQSCTVGTHPLPLLLLLLVVRALPALPSAFHGRRHQRHPHFVSWLRCVERRVGRGVVAALTRCLCFAFRVVSGRVALHSRWPIGLFVSVSVIACALLGPGFCCS